MTRVLIQESAIARAWRKVKLAGLLLGVFAGSLAVQNFTVISRARLAELQRAHREAVEWADATWGASDDAKVVKELLDCTKAGGSFGASGDGFVCQVAK